VITGRIAVIGPAGANRKQLHDEIDAVFSTLTVEELETRLEEGKIAHARLAAGHPWVNRRDPDMYVSV
jgi:hypothetical protein